MGSGSVKAIDIDTKAVHIDSKFSAVYVNVSISIEEISEHFQRTAFVFVLCRKLKRFRKFCKVFYRCSGLTLYSDCSIHLCIALVAYTFRIDLTVCTLITAAAPSCFVILMLAVVDYRK